MNKDAFPVHPNLNSTDDPKIARTENSASSWCPQCHRNGPNHAITCEHATWENSKEDVVNAKKGEAWARKRAGYWLNECRKMHGKIAMLTAELKKLRRRSKNE